jgi:hypothetical protein
MTKVLEINCDHAILVIKLTLWVLASIAVSYITIAGYGLMINGYDYKTSTCDNDPSNMFCKTIHHSPIADVFILGIILDIIDGVFFWLVINHKYKIVELRCKRDNKNAQEKTL